MNLLRAVALLLLGVLFLLPAVRGQDRRIPLDTAEQRRDYVLKSIVLYANGLDDLVIDWTSDGREREARLLSEHAAEIRLGWTIPAALKGVKGVSIDGKLQTVSGTFEAARKAAVEACDTAIRRAREAGDLNGLKKLQIERKGLVSLNKDEFDFWSPMPEERSGVRFGRVTEKVPLLMGPNDRRIPNELTTTFGPKRFRIEGTANVDTVRVNGVLQGHFGKLVVIEESLNTENPFLRGVLRVKTATRTDHTNYAAVFIRGNRILASPKLILQPGITYDWECRYDKRTLRFELLENGRTLLKRDQPSTGTVRIGFASSVRYPGDRASIVVGYR